MAWRRGRGVSPFSPSPPHYVSTPLYSSSSVSSSFPSTSFSSDSIFPPLSFFIFHHTHIHFHPLLLPLLHFPRSLLPPLLLPSLPQVPYASIGGVSPVPLGADGLPGEGERRLDLRAISHSLALLFRRRWEGGLCWRLEGDGVRRHVVGRQGLMVCSDRYGR